MALPENLGFSTLDSQERQGIRLNKMKILIAIDDYLNKSNGMCISTQRFVKDLRDNGNEVRIVSNNRHGDVDYSMDVLRIPFFADVIEKEGYSFAKPNQQLIREAVSWAEVVHVEDPFFLCKRVADETKKQNKPLTGAFHIYPENMTYAVHIGNIRLVNKLIMKLFIHNVYKKCDCVQCPTENVKIRLQNQLRKVQLEVISNGISDDFLGLEKKPRSTVRNLNVLSIGRYSVEKNQELLLEAIALCKNKRNIQLTIAGKGPLEGKLKYKSEKLDVNTEFGFFSQEELKERMLESDVYVHCADVEVEGMSCMEAFSCGCVPIISDAELSSTKNYALYENDRFEAGNPESLAEKIDFWFEHPDILTECSGEYIELANQLSIHKSTVRLIKMMENAVDKKKYGA